MKRPFFSATARLPVLAPARPSGRVWPRCSDARGARTKSSHHGRDGGLDDWALSVNQLHGGGSIDLQSFQDHGWKSQTPLQISNGHGLPAMTRWFAQTPDGRAVFHENMKSCHDVIVPYEFYEAPDPQASCREALRAFQQWLRDSPEAGPHELASFAGSLVGLLESSSSAFHQFDAPLGLLTRACQFNMMRSSRSECLRQLYVAQSSLDGLPETLSRDLPTPEVVRRAGKGDIYGSSIWLGLQPTYTPLHRDPNPNLFCQMVGSKSILLIKPQSGELLYARVRRALGAMGNSRLRGTEMMAGPERDLLRQAVWHGSNSGVGGDVEKIQARLEPGDVLFIPKGWWHSVISNGQDAELNASVNWWFR
ncbi:Clavaminate synthase-like protein [Xylariaceae sp. FL0804]|nr:Clavaminate synthase-like protein [Xylariaceae sp. FL0804]